MNCFKCNSENFKIVTLRDTRDYKDIKNLEYVFEVEQCENCGANRTTGKLKNDKLIALIDAYKKEKELYTSKEIKSFRKKLGMSQEAFAKFLHVGPASLARWESKGIQDEGSNELIKMKCDETSQNETLIRYWEAKEPSEFTGNVNFKIKKFVAILSEIIDSAPSPLFFFKALFYIDAIHYVKNGRGVTGLTYSCLQYGPIPYDYRPLVEYVKKKYGEPINLHDFKLPKLFNEKDFSTSEIEAITCVKEVLSKKGRNFILDQSHEHEVFKNAEYKDCISYKAIKSVNIL